MRTSSVAFVARGGWGLFFLDSPVTFVVPFLSSFLFSCVLGQDYPPGDESDFEYDFSTDENTDGEDGGKQQDLTLAVGVASNVDVLPSSSS